MTRDTIYDERYSSAAVEKQKVVVAAPCFVASIVVANTGASDTWIHVMDTNAIPDDESVPLLQKKVLSGGTEFFDFGFGRRFNTGLYVAMGTTSVSTSSDGIAAFLITAIYRTMKP